MAIRIYEMQDRSTGVATCTNSGLSLQAVEHMTDWTAEEFDAIASMEIGQECLYSPFQGITNSGIYIKRTA
jgi:hypothetical protein